MNAPDMQARLNELGMTPLPLVGADYTGFIQAETANGDRSSGPAISRLNEIQGTE